MITNYKKIIFGVLAILTVFLIILFIYLVINSKNSQPQKTNNLTTDSITKDKAQQKYLILKTQSGYYFVENNSLYLAKDFDQQKTIQELDAALIKDSLNIQPDCGIIDAQENFLILKQFNLAKTFKFLLIDLKNKTLVSLNENIKDITFYQDNNLTKLYYIYSDKNGLVVSLNKSLIDGKDWQKITDADLYIDNLIGFDSTSNKIVIIMSEEGGENFIASIDLSSSQNTYEPIATNIKVAYLDDGNIYYTSYDNIDQKVIYNLKNGQKNIKTGPVLTNCIPLPK